MGVIYALILEPVVRPMRPVLGKPRFSERLVFIADDAHPPEVRRRITRGPSPRASDGKGHEPIKRAPVAPAQFERW